MGKKRREERKVSVQNEPRRPSVGLYSSNTSSLANRPTSRVTIDQVVANGHNVGFEQCLSDNLVPSTDLASYLESIRSVNSKDDAVVSSVCPPLDSDGRFHHLESSKKGSFPPPSSLENSDSRRKWKRWAYKNVYGLSLAYVVLFTAFVGLQNVQSSIHSAGGLGLVTLSLLYAMFIVAGFVTPGFLKLFGTKYSLLFGFVCHLIYTLANYYPSWYTLVPGSVLIGFASGPIWAAASTHLAKVALTVAPSLRKKQDYLISKFTGVFFFFFQFSQVPGNLASSLILFPYSEDVAVDLDSATDFNISNETLESESCDIITSQSFDIRYLYILVSVYVVFIVTSIVLLLMFVDHLPTSNSFFSTEKKLELYLKKPLIELLKVLRDVKMVLIAPMVVYNGMELAFAFGTFTEVYISQCFGTYQVGFTLIVLGVCSALMSIIYSRLLKYLPRFLIVLFGVVLSVSMLMFMLLWERVPSYYVIFVIAIGWGAADAVWTTMPTNLTGILFSSCSDVAYSAMRIWQAVGFTAGFVIAELLSFHHRVWVLLVTVVVAAIVGLIIEFTTQSKEELLPCIFRKRQHADPSSDDTQSSGSANNGTEQTQGEYDDNRIVQNPMFIVYGGRRPSAMSTWSTDSLDGVPTSMDSTTAAATVVNGGTLLQQNGGQNPIFVMYNGRRPSTGSVNSAFAHSDACKSSTIIPTTIFVDGEDGRQLSTTSSDSITTPYPPLIITTVPYVSSDLPACRVLTPIHECEDDNEEHPTMIKNSSQTSIQRSHSYEAALGDSIILRQV